MRKNNINRRLVKSQMKVRNINHRQNSVGSNEGGSTQSGLSQAQLITGNVGDARHRLLPGSNHILAPLNGSKQSSTYVVDYAFQPKMVSTVPKTRNMQASSSNDG